MIDGGGNDSVPRAGLLRIAHLSGRDDGGGNESGRQSAQLTEAVVERHSCPGQRVCGGVPPFSHHALNQRPFVY
jgi:hypothetical protein